MKKAGTLHIYIAVLFLITLFLRVTLIQYYDSSLGGIEQNVIYGIQRILLGQPLYQHPAAGSYAIMQYTPLWYYTIAGIARLISADSYRHGLDVQGIYILCRVVALACNLLTVGMCALIIRSWRIGAWSSFLFALPVLMVLTAHYYTRGDSLHLLLFTTSVFWYACYSRKGRMLYVILAALFTAACIMTKQSGILIAAVTTAGLVFILRTYFAAVIYCLCTVAFSLAIARLFNNGDWPAFYQNTVLGLKNGIDATFLYNMFTSRYFLDLVPCYILAAVMVFTTSKATDKTYRFILLGMCCSWIFAAVTGLKKGSSNNYFTEFLLFLFIGMPYFLHNRGFREAFRLFHRTVAVRHVAYLCLLVLVTSKTTGLLTAVYIGKSFTNNRQEYENEQHLYAFFEDTLHIQPTDRVFFTERRYLDNIFVRYSVLPTKDVSAQVFAANPATIDYSHIRQKASNGMIQYVVTDQKRDDINICNDSLPFTWFDKSKFRLVARVSGYSIYAWSPEG